MAAYCVRDARRLFSKLIDVAERGGSVHVVRRGTPVAVIGPVRPDEKKLPSLRKFRSSLKVKGPGLSETVIQARKEERF